MYSSQLLHVLCAPIDVSYGMSVPRRLDRQSRRGAASLLDHTHEYKWMVEDFPFLSGEAADLDHT
jgi:hypothetical protein